MDFTIRNVIALAALEECEHLNMEYRERFNAADAFELSDRKFVKIFRLKKNMVETLIERLEDFMNPVKRSSDLDVDIKVSKVHHFLDLLYINLCSYIHRSSVLYVFLDPEATKKILV
jgi:hypothetical protein